MWAKELRLNYYRIQHRKSLNDMKALGREISHMENSIKRNKERIEELKSEAKLWDGTIERLES